MIYGTVAAFALAGIRWEGLVEPPIEAVYSDFKAGTYRVAGIPAPLSAVWESDVFDSFSSSFDPAQDVVPGVGFRAVSDSDVTVALTLGAFAETGPEDQLGFVTHVRFTIATDGNFQFTVADSNNFYEAYFYAVVNEIYEQSFLDSYPNGEKTLTGSGTLPAGTYDIVWGINPNIALLYTSNGKVLRVKDVSPAVDDLFSYNRITLNVGGHASIDFVGIYSYTSSIKGARSRAPIHFDASASLSASASITFKSSLDAVGSLTAVATGGTRAPHAGNVTFEATASFTAGAAVLRPGDLALIPPGSIAHLDFKGDKYFYKGGRAAVSDLLGADASLVADDIWGSPTGLSSGNIAPGYGLAGGGNNYPVFLRPLLDDLADGATIVFKFYSPYSAATPTWLVWGNESETQGTHSAYHWLESIFNSEDYFGHQKASYGFGDRYSSPSYFGDVNYRLVPGFSSQAWFNMFAMTFTKSRMAIATGGLDVQSHDMLYPIIGDIDYIYLSATWDSFYIEQMTIFPPQDDATLKILGSPPAALLGRGSLTVAASGGSGVHDISARLSGSGRLKWDTVFAATGSLSATAQLGPLQHGVANLSARANMDFYVGPSARYWRLKITANNNSFNTIINDMALAISPGGSDQTSPGGAISTNSDLNSFGYSIANLVDNTSAAWASLGGFIGPFNPIYIVYDFGVGVTKAIRELRLTVDGGDPSPKDFTLEFSSDGTTWNVYGRVTGSTSWTFNETRTFTFP